MARIRSIKPDFFTSEAIASLPISARLTFIGLWTHVDDNGVAVDNDRLISAAIWPLEDDPREALQRLREDLRRLHETRLITRYEVDGKRYLFVRSWDEHQKVSHPKKPRYPRPGGDGCTILTCEDTPTPSVRAKSSGGSPENLRKPRETFRPEQGAGSREQGGQPSAAELSPSAPSSAAHAEGLTETQRSKRITDAYAAVEPMCKWVAVNAVVLKAIKAEKYSDDEIRDALLRLANDGRSVTVDTLRIELNGMPASKAASSGYRPFQNPTDPSVYESGL